MFIEHYAVQQCESLAHLQKFFWKLPVVVCLLIINNLINTNQQEASRCRTTPFWDSIMFRLLVSYENFVWSTETLKINRNYDIRIGCSLHCFLRTPHLFSRSPQYHSTHTHTQSNTIFTVFSALKYGAKSLYAARYYCLFITNTSALTETVTTAITLSQTTVNYFRVFLGLHSKYKINCRVIISDLMSDVTSINVTKVIISNFKFSVTFFVTHWDGESKIFLGTCPYISFWTAKHKCDIAHVWENFGKYRALTLLCQ